MTIGGVLATNVVADVTGTVPTAVTPSGVAGNAGVVVTTPAGSVTVTGGFTYRCVCGPDGDLRPAHAHTSITRN